jgi:ABC-type glycerol-3-phosphate transport system substrate-binding protein
MTSNHESNQSSLTRRGYLTAAGLGAAALAGCSGNGDGDGDGDGDGGGATITGEEIVLTVMNTGYPDRKPDIMEPIAEEFNSQHSNIRMENEYIGWGEVYQVIGTQIAQDQQPDIVKLGNLMLTQLRQQSGVQRPVTDYVPDETLEPHLLTEQIRYGDDDIIPMVPVNSGNISGHWFYRKDVWEEAGLDPESPPETYDEVIEQFDTIQENTDVAPIGIPLNRASATNMDGWTDFLMKFNDAPVLDAPEGGVNFNTDGGIEGTEMWLQMEEYAQAGPSDYSRWDLRVPFTERTTAVHIDGPWAWPTMADGFDVDQANLTDAEELGIALSPEGPEGYRGRITIDGWIPLRDAGESHFSAMQELMTYLSSYEVINQDCELTGSVPVREDIANEEEWAQGEHVQLVTEAARDSYVRQPHLNVNEFNLDVAAPTLQDIWNENVTVEEGLQQMEDAVAGF